MSHDGSLTNTYRQIMHVICWPELGQSLGIHQNSISVYGIKIMVVLLNRVIPS